MKKHILPIAAILISTALLSSKAMACEGPYCEKEFSVFRIVGAPGSFVEKTSFGWDETPWIYVKITDKKDKVSTSWLDDLGNKYITSWSAVNKKGKVWISLTNWKDVRKTGEWTVNGYIGYLTCGGIKLDKHVCPIKASFVVTPEPVAMVLYGLGGLPLAVQFLRRRKQILA